MSMWSDRRDFKSPPSTPKPVSTPAYRPDESQTPGKWRHPRLKEILKRQDASTFGQNNARRLLWNGTVLVATWIFGNSLKSQLLRLHLFFKGYPANVDPALFAIQLYLTVNILVALYPLFRPKDELIDIPLTPTQRALFGLDPAATPPPTPDSSYVTPPRYRLSGSRTSPLSRGSSPLSGSTSKSGQTYSPGTSFSPSTSPLLQKAIANGNRESGQKQSLRSPSPVGRRSFGSSSPFARSSPLKESSVSSLGSPTPSPTGKRGPSLALSNKWLYERSGRLSTSSNPFSL